MKAGMSHYLWLARVMNTIHREQTLCIPYAMPSSLHEIPGIPIRNCSFRMKTQMAVEETAYITFWQLSCALRHVSINTSILKWKLFIKNLRFAYRFVEFGIVSCYVPTSSNLIFLPLIFWIYINEIGMGNQEWTIQRHMTHWPQHIAL